MQIQRLQIHSGHTNELTNRHAANKLQGGAAGSANSAGVNKTAGDDGSQVLQSAVDSLQRLPEVRPDVVAAAQERLANGDYNSRELAEQTAASILDRA